MSLLKTQFVIEETNLEKKSYRDDHDKSSDCIHRPIAYSKDKNNDIKNDIRDFHLRGKTKK